jgi:hypothetical protein
VKQKDGSYTDDHVKAGEAHLKAAAEFKKLGDGLAYKQAASHHLKEAAMHAAAAGSAWDEEKHPRDENGKFA